MTEVIFARVHNAGCSQMAQAFFNALVDSTRGQVISGGTEPAREVHWEVVEAMREVGLEFADGRHLPRSLCQRYPEARAPAICFQGVALARRLL